MNCVGQQMLLETIDLSLFLLRVKLSRERMAFRLWEDRICDVTERIRDVIKGIRVVVVVVDCWLSVEKQGLIIIINTIITIIVVAVVGVVENHIGTVVD